MFNVRGEVRHTLWYTIPKYLPLQYQSIGIEFVKVDRYLLLTVFKINHNLKERKKPTRKLGAGKWDSWKYLPR